MKKLFKPLMHEMYKDYCLPGNPGHKNEMDFDTFSEIISGISLYYLEHIMTLLKSSKAS